mgnify:CR=1 FL=1
MKADVWTYTNKYDRKKHYMHTYQTNSLHERQYTEYRMVSCYHTQVPVAKSNSYKKLPPDARMRFAKTVAGRSQVVAAKTKSNVKHQTEHLKIGMIMVAIMIAALRRFWLPS